VTEARAPGTELRRTPWPYRALKTVVAVALFAMAALTFLDVMGRYVFSAPIPGTFENVGLLMGAVVFSALPLITRADEHITVGLFDRYFRGTIRKLRRLVILIGSALVMAFFTERLWFVALDELRTGYVTEYSNFSRAPYLIVLSFLGAVTVLVSLIMVRRSLTGKPPDTDDKPADGDLPPVDPSESVI